MLARVSFIPEGHYTLAHFSSAVPLPIAVQHADMFQTCEKCLLPYIHTSWTSSSSGIVVMAHVMMLVWLVGGGGGKGGRRDSNRSGVVAFKEIPSRN